MFLSSNEKNLTFPSLNLSIWIFIKNWSWLRYKSLPSYWRTTKLIFNRPPNYCWLARILATISRISIRVICIVNRSNLSIAKNRSGNFLKSAASLPFQFMTISKTTIGTYKWMDKSLARIVLISQLSKVGNIKTLFQVKKSKGTYHAEISNNYLNCLIYRRRSLIKINKRLAYV